LEIQDIWFWRRPADQNVPVAGSDKDRTSKRSGGAVVAACGAIVRQQNLRVILLAAAKRAADGVEPK
jgi:hypothetical protein